MIPRIVLYGNRPVNSPYVMAVFVALEEKGLRSSAGATLISQ
jgi:hypothetical protein